MGDHEHPHNLRCVSRVSGKHGPCVKYERVKPELRGSVRYCTACGGDGFLVTRGDEGKDPACPYCQGSGRIRRDD